MSQNELSKRLTARGLPFYQATVQRVESGERAVRLDEAFVISEVLDASLDTMIASYTGPMEDAYLAIARARRRSDLVLADVSDWFAELMDEFDQLALAFVEQLAADSHKATPAVVWMAAWIIKFGRIIEAWLDLELYSGALNAKSPDWMQDLPKTVVQSWDDVKWVCEEGSDIWMALPETERPQYLSDLRTDELQAWIRDRTNGEHSEASER